MKETIKNRCEFMVLVEGELVSINSDADTNTPRQDPETMLGYVTDVAIKRRSRDYVEDAYGNEPGYEIMYRNGASLNKIIAESVFEANGISGTDELPKIKKNNKLVPLNKKVEESKQIILDRFWDVRTFGAVLSTGLNAGQVTGPVQIGIARSVDPIQIEEITIDRICYTTSDGNNSLKTLEDYKKEEESRPSSEKRTFGTKSFMMYGLYVIKGTISASLAEKTGFTEKDMERFFESLIRGYEHSISASKQGARIVSPVIIFKHVGTQPAENVEQNLKEAKLGCVPAHKLFNLVKIAKKDGVETPRSFDDYNVSMEFSRVPKGVEIGLKFNPFEPVYYGEDYKPHLAGNGWMDVDGDVVKA